MLRYCITVGLVIMVLCTSVNLAKRRSPKTKFKGKSYVDLQNVPAW